MTRQFFVLMGGCLVSLVAYAGVTKQTFTVEVNNTLPLSRLVPDDLLMDDPWSKTYSDATEAREIFAWEWRLNGDVDSVVLRSDPDQPTITQPQGADSVTFRFVQFAPEDRLTVGEIRDRWEWENWRWPTLRELIVIMQSAVMEEKRLRFADCLTLVEAQTVKEEELVGLIAVYRQTYARSSLTQPKLDFFDGFQDTVITIPNLHRDTYLIAVLP